MERLAINPKDSERFLKEAEADSTPECEVCHAKHDRDVNAAVNIKDFGLRNYIAFRKDVGLDKSEVTLRESVPLGTT